MASIQQFHGEVRRCHCGIADNPIIGSDKGCVHCKNRGFLASCKACDGTGSFVAQMAGGPGSMSSVCIPCGGTGTFGVNRPADWVDAEKPAEAEATA